jgi:thioesterase domain-containing protein
MADCLDRVQPQGPLRLVGVCFGGLVAFEAACCLRARGRSVELLAMVDTLNPAWRRSRPSFEVVAAFLRMAARRTVWHLHALRELSLKDKAAYLLSRVRALRETLSDEFGTAIEPRRLHRGAQSEYSPARRYAGRVLLFEMEARRLPAPLLGWDGLLDSTAVVESLPFDAQGALSEATAPLVARVIRCILGQP